MFDFSLNNILHSNVINFAIMIAVFAFIINKLNVAQKIEDMRASIQKKVEDSDNLREEAKKDYEKVEASLANVDEEIDAISRKAEETAKSFEATSKHDLENSVEIIKRNAEKQIISEENHIQASLMSDVSAVSVKVAQEQIKVALNNDRNLHRKYIEEFIDDIENIEV